MPDDPTKKSTRPVVRVDHDQKLIYIPGRDEPLPLLAPIVQKVDREGVPYQHQATVSEMMEADDAQERAMQFIRNAMKCYWRCAGPECLKVCQGLRLRISPEMIQIVRGMMKPGEKARWHDIVEEIGRHMFCPSCGSLAKALSPAELQRAVEKGEVRA